MPIVLTPFDFVLPPTRLISAAVLCCAFTIGCRTNPSASSGWPWTANPPTSSSVFGGTANPSQPNAAQWAHLADVMQRQEQQSQLSEQQRQALAQLTEWQRQQQSQMGMLAEQKQQEEFQKIQQQAERLQAQQKELEGLAELRRRSLELDANNRDLHAQLGQSQQQNRLLEDQLKLVKQQLNDTAQKLSAAMTTQADANRRIQAVQQEADQRVSALQANLQRRGGATITANSSLQQNLSPVSIAGLKVRQDGDVVRIEVPTDKIFMPGTATLNSSALTLIDQVAGSVREHYPRQVIGIEAHTDNAAVDGASWRSNHQLSAAQAMAVFDQLTHRHQFGAKQLFVAGHGSNYPLTSNGTSAGRQRNRRVEIVIYPETVGTP